MKRKILMIAAALLLTSCADTQQLVRHNEASKFTLNSSDSVYVAVPKNGAYGTHTYEASGATTAKVVMAAFLRHTSRVKSGNVSQSFDEAIAAARKTDSKYLAFPIILHWEDRATEWSLKPDRVEIKIEVFNVVTQKPVTSAIVSGKSGLATFGGDHPQDLLPEPISTFVASLY